MGGLISFLYLVRHADTVRAAALSSPAFALPPQGPRAQLALVGLLARIAPKIAFTTKLEPDALARDPEVGRKYVADPLVHRKATAGFARAFIRAQERALADAPKVTTPLLILQAEADRLVTPAGASAIAARLRCEHVLEMLPGYYHELLNEPISAREVVIARLDAWFEALPETPATMLLDDRQQRRHHHSVACRRPRRPPIPCRPRQPDRSASASNRELMLRDQDLAHLAPRGRPYSFRWRALEAVALDRALGTGDLARATDAYFAAARRIVDDPWMLATLTDSIYPAVRGTRPWGASGLQWYLARVLALTGTNEGVYRRFLDVVHMTAPLRALFHPAVVGAVLAPTRRG